jgi:hypothetical protein
MVTRVPAAAIAETTTGISGLNADIGKVISPA